MIFLNETALLHDAVTFGMWYFNREKMEEKLIVPCTDPELSRSAFRQFYDAAGELPALLEPFFHIGADGHSPLSARLEDLSPDLSPDAFLCDIREKSDALRLELLRCIFRISAVRCRALFFSPESDGTARFLAEVEKVNLSPNLKLQFSLLTGNFSYGIELLCKILRELCEAAEKVRFHLRREFDRERENVLIALKSGLYRDFLPETANFMSELSENSEPGTVLLLLSPEEITVRKREDGAPVLFLGLRHDEALAAATAAGESADAFLVACGSETGVQVIHRLMEEGELTVSDLARRLHAPVTTLLKHVEALHAGKVIYISRRAGLKIYYRLNLTYFREVRASVNELFRKILFESK